MKNLLLLFFTAALLSCLTPHTFSQELNINKLTLNAESISILKNQSGSLKWNRILPDSSRPDTTKKEKPKTWWETLLNFDFWNKLSGPGPFIGAGIEYPVFKFQNAAIFIGGSVSHSLDNTLQYYIPIYKDSLDTSGNIVNRLFLRDSCIECSESKAVQMVSLKVDAQYRIPKSQFDLFLGVGLHTFFGEAFTTFSRISGIFGGGWRVLKYIRVGVMVNLFEHFKPSTFGAVDGQDSTGSMEFVPGAFVSVSLH